jgi:signal transduction histidine kinase/DNA-binding NarL/FixJ family response regulator
MLGYLIVSVAIWTFTTALDMASISLEGKVFWSKIQYIGIYSTPGFLFLFIYYFYKNNKPLNKKAMVFVWLIPVLTIIFAFTNGWHSLIWTGFSPSPVPDSNLIIYHHGYWFWFAFLYFYLLLLTTLYYLYRTYKESPPNKKRNARLLLIAFPFPVIGNILYNFNLSPWPGYDLTSVGFAIATVFLFWGVRRQSLADLTPIAREKLFDSLDEGVLILDEDEKIVDHNQAIMDIIRRKGYEPVNGLLNKSVEEIIQEMEDLVLLFHSENSYPCTLNAITVDEPTLEINQQILLDDEDNPAGRLIIVRDITQQKQAEMQLMWQHRMLAAEQERKDIGRELHDNLAQVLGYINLQSKTILNLVEEGDITNAVANIAQLINVSQDATDDVRGFINESRKEIKPKKGFLPALNSYIDSFRKLTNLPVHFTHSEIDFEAITNTQSRLQILRIIQEGLSNARKHSNATEIHIIFSQSLKNLNLTIQDNGVGFDLNQLNLEGHFGLRIMKERAFEAGGKLSILSKPEQGTSIHLILPIDKSIAQVELAKMKFMIVDDHPLFVDGIMNLLRSKGLDVIAIARSGEEALEKLKEFHPGIILMDAQMPGLSGQETTRLIKQKYPEIKVLMLTMSDHPADLQVAIQSGVNGYLLKSQSPQDLFINLERMLTDPLVVSTEMTKRLVDRRTPNQDEALKIDVPATIYELSAVELEILERVAIGEGYKEIGAALNLSPHTIKYHFNKVLNKLEIETRAEAIHMAIRAGLIKGRRQTDPVI